MPNASLTKMLWLTAALALTSCRRAQKSPQPDDFVAAMNSYLQERGDLCIARADWPVDVAPGDVAQRTRDAVQMPVLERLKLVQSSALPGGVTRYQLTAVGKRHYIARDTRQPVSPEGPQHQTADFCVARLTLDQITHVELLRPAKGPARAVITYTYGVQAPEWTRDPAARAAFPAVDRVISGAHTATLREELTRTPGGWVAVEQQPPTGAAGKVAIAASAAQP